MGRKSEDRMNSIPSSPWAKRITKIMCSMPILILPPELSPGQLTLFNPFPYMSIKGRIFLFSKYHILGFKPSWVMKALSFWSFHCPIRLRREKTDAIEELRIELAYNSSLSLGRELLRVSPIREEKGWAGLLTEQKKKKINSEDPIDQWTDLSAVLNWT